MRVPYDVMRDGLTSINRAAEAMAAAQRQVSTGRRLNRLGDDAAAAQQSVTEHALMNAADTYSRTRSAASSRLAAADATLSAFGDKLSAVIVAAMSAKGTAVPATARAAAADLVAGLRDSLLADLNSKFDGNAVFAGTNAGTDAYANIGGAWVYQGNSGTQQLEFEQGRLVSVSFDGQAIAQGSDAQDVFSVIDGLVTAIQAGDDAGISTAVTGIERAMDRALRAQGRLGADERGLDDAEIRLSALRRAADVRRSTLEDANMAEAISRLSQTETAYRAALASVSAVERVSLLDYLR